MPAPDVLAATWLGVVAEEEATAAAAAAAASDCDRAASKLLVDVVVPWRPKEPPHLKKNNGNNTET